MTDYHGVGAHRAAAVALLVLGLATRAAAQSVWHVAKDGTGDGSSWNSPTNSLQGAIDACAVGGWVWVAPGTYDTGGMVGYPGGQTALTNRVAVWKAITVASSNFNPTATIIQGAWHPVTTNGSAAVRGVYVAAGAKLIGFTVSGGATRASAETLPYGAGWYSKSGGGIFCENNTSAIISNCVITGNVADGEGNNASYGGGGVFRGLLSDCTVQGNISYTGGGVHSSVLTNHCVVRANLVSKRAGNDYPNGGGAYGSTLYDCVVAANTNMQSNGGGVSGGTVFQCLVVSNYSFSYGAGVYGAAAGDVKVYNSRIIYNTTAGRGAGAYGAFLYNCLLMGNYAGANYGGGAKLSSLWNCTVVSNRFRDNSTHGVGLHDCKAITNCIVQFNSQPNGVPGNYDNATCTNFFSSCTWPAQANWDSSNTTNNPKFVDLAGGNYRLTGGSPCIDSGANLSWQSDPADVRSKDLDGAPRVRGASAKVDMGAYEFAPLFSGTVVLFH